MSKATPAGPLEVTFELYGRAGHKRHKAARSQCDSRLQRFASTKGAVLAGASCWFIRSRSCLAFLWGRGSQSA